MRSRWRRPRRRWPRAAGLARCRGLPERRPHAGALARPLGRGGAGTRWPREGARRVLVVPDRLRLRPHRDPLRHRRAGGGGGRGGSGSRCARTESLNTSPTLHPRPGRPRARRGVADARADVVVVGGGIAGLSAARALHAARPRRSVLLEASPRWGGVIRTERADGFLLEGGPDSILAQKPEGLALCRELGLGDRLVPTNPQRARSTCCAAAACTRCPRAWCSACPRGSAPFLRSGLFSWPASCAWRLELVAAARASAAADESIASFLGARLGRGGAGAAGRAAAGRHPRRRSRRGSRSARPSRGSSDLGAAARQPDARDVARRAPQGRGRVRRSYSLRGRAGRARRRAGGAPARRLGAGRAGRRAVALRRDGRLARGRPATGPGRRARGGRPGRAAPTPRRRSLAPPVRGGGGACCGDAASPPRPPCCSATAARTSRIRLDGYGLLVPARRGPAHAPPCTFVSTKLPGPRAGGPRAAARVPGRRARPGRARPRRRGHRRALVRARDGGPLLGLARRRPWSTRVYRWPRGTPQMEVGHLDADGRGSTRALARRARPVRDRRRPARDRPAGRHRRRPADGGKGLARASPEPRCRLHRSV